MPQFPICRKRSNKGIQVAITNMNLGDMSFLAGGYTSDDATNGKIVGTNAAEFIKANLTGPRSTWRRVDFDDQIPEQSKARWDGFLRDWTKPGVEYTKVAAVSSHVQDDALTKVTDMLTAHPEINVIWACNDGGTIGAAMAVKQAGLEGKVVRLRL
jgi:sugar transport system substrate-binding protein